MRLFDPTRRRLGETGRLSVAVLAGVLLGGGGYAIAASSGTTVHSCVVTRSHELLVQPRCTRGERRLILGQTGPTGATGATGATGPTGPTGPQGPQGVNATPAEWEVVNSSGTKVAGMDLGIQHLATGDYQVTKATPGTQTCAVQVTPSNGGGAIPPPDVVAAVTNGAAGQQIYFQTHAGTFVDSGFSVDVQC
jgi:hypothetical protein